MNLVGRIHRHFPSLAIWDGRMMRADVFTDEDEIDFLRRTCSGKAWRDVPVEEASGIYFSPAHYLTREGVLYILPLLMTASVKVRESDAPMHLINSINDVRQQLFGLPFNLTEAQKEVIIDWLRFIQERDEGEFWGDATSMLEKLSKG